MELTLPILFGVAFALGATCGPVARAARTGTPVERPADVAATAERR